LVSTRFEKYVATSPQPGETRGRDRFPRPMRTSKRKENANAMLIDGFRRLNRKRKRIIWVLESRRDHILSGVDIQNIRVPHNRMSSITRQKLWSDVHTHTPRNIKTHAYQYAPYFSKSGLHKANHSVLRNASVGQLNAWFRKNGTDPSRR